MMSGPFSSSSSAQGSSSSSSSSSWKGGAPRGAPRSRALKGLEKKLGLSPALAASLTPAEGASLLYLAFLWTWLLLGLFLSAMGLLNLLRALQAGTGTPSSSSSASLRSPLSLSRPEASLAGSLGGGGSSGATGASQDVPLFGGASVGGSGEGAASSGLGAGAQGAGAGAGAGAAATEEGRAAMEVGGTTGGAATMEASSDGGAAGALGATDAGAGAGQAGSADETGWGTSGLQGTGSGAADVSGGQGGSTMAEVLPVQGVDAAGASSAGGGGGGGWQGAGSGGAETGTGSLVVLPFTDASGSGGAVSGTIPFFQSAGDAGATGVTVSATQGMGTGESAGGGATNGMWGGVGTVTQAQGTVTQQQQAQAAPVYTGEPRLQILGTKLPPGVFVTKFKNRWACLVDYHKAAWELDPTPRPLPWPTLSKAFPSCTRREGFLGDASNADVTSGAFTDQNWPVAQSVKYTWRLREGAACSGKPPKMGQFAGEAFCAAMQRRKGPLFIIGDSTSGQFFFSLLEQLKLRGLPVEQQEPPASCSRLTEDVLKNREGSGFLRSIWPLCTRFLVCGPSPEEGGVHVHFALSQYLGGANETTRGQKEQLWGEDLASQQPSVVVLNRGAHYVKNGRFQAELDSTLQNVRRLAPEAMVVFRSTTTGHPQCEEYTQPLEVPLPLDSAPGQWLFFAKQNKLAKALVEKVSGFFFDVESMNSVRPDWHVVGHNNDCWHHCQPGPVDDWVRVFAILISEAL